MTVLVSAGLRRPGWAYLGSVIVDSCRLLLECEERVALPPAMDVPRLLPPGNLQGLLARASNGPRREGTAQQRGCKAE